MQATAPNVSDQYFVAWEGTTPNTSINTDTAPAERRGGTGAIQHPTTAVNILAVEAALALLF